MIIDTVQSAGGTFIPPQGYYQKAAELVRSGAIGPDMNTLKIRPPMCINHEQADIMLNVIDDSFDSLK